MRYINRLFTYLLTYLLTYMINTLKTTILFVIYARTRFTEKVSKRLCYLNIVSKSLNKFRRR